MKHWNSTDYNKTLLSTYILTWALHVWIIWNPIFVCIYYQLYIVSELMLKNFENFSIISNMAKECIYKKFFLSFLNRLNVVFKQNYNNSKYPIPSDTWDLWKRSKAICYPLQSMTALSNSLLHDFYFNFFKK